MPWRKQTLTPFRTSPSCRASDSGGFSNSDELSCPESPQQLFGGSECEINFNALGSMRSVSKVLDSQRLESSVDGLAEPILPKAQFDRFLGHAFLSVAQPCDIKMPWEKGVFAQIFGEDLPQPQLTVPCPQLTAVDSEASDVVQDLFATAPDLDVSAGSIFPHAISCLSDKDYSCKLADLSRRACDKWLSILVLDLQASEVGRNLATLGDLDVHRDEVLGDHPSGHWCSIMQYCCDTCKFNSQVLEVHPAGISECWQPISGESGVEVLSLPQGLWGCHSSGHNLICTQVCKAHHGFLQS